MKKLIPILIAISLIAIAVIAVNVRKEPEQNPGLIDTSEFSVISSGQNETSSENAYMILHNDDQAMIWIEELTPEGNMTIKIYQKPVDLPESDDRILKWTYCLSAVFLNNTLMPFTEKVTVTPGITEVIQTNWDESELEQLGVSKVRQITFNLSCENQNGIAAAGKQDLGTFTIAVPEANPGTDEELVEDPVPEIVETIPDESIQPENIETVPEEISDSVQEILPGTILFDNNICAMSYIGSAIDSQGDLIIQTMMMNRTEAETLIFANGRTPGLNGREAIVGFCREVKPGESVPANITVEQREVTNAGGEIFQINLSVTVRSAVSASYYIEDTFDIAADVRSEH